MSGRPAESINPDNAVEIMSNRLAFGQGTQNALPMLIAAELDLAIASLSRSQRKTRSWPSRPGSPPARPARRADRRKGSTRRADPPRRTDS